MLSVQYAYSGKRFTINPYNTAQEKDLLLSSTVGDYSIDGALTICGVQESVINSLTDDEKIAFLYKLREISVGEELQIKFKCNKCSAQNENVLLISNIITDSNITDDRIKDAYKQLTNENIQNFTTVEIDELDLNEYSEIKRIIKESVTKFDFVKPVMCQKCSHKNLIQINKPEFVIENLSEDSLMTIYQSYNDLVFHGRYTKLDIDSLYPFERLIIISLINKTKNELNNATQA